MTDFSTMTDAEIRQYKNERYRTIRQARDEMAEAQVALEALRAKSDERWRAASVLATEMVPDKYSDAHTEATQRLYDSPEDLKVAAKSLSEQVSTFIKGTSARAEG